MFLFSAQNLAQTKGDQDIFKNVNLEVHVGEKVALVGPNGIGKTTLLRILAGIDKPVDGKLRFFSQIQTGYLTQNEAFPPEATVQTVLETTSLKKPNINWQEALSRFNFTGFESQKVSLLSGGEKTRLKLACLWLQGCDLLLLDEPSNHLDMEQLNWLEKYLRDYPGTVLVVSHDRYFLDRIVSRVVELSKTGITSYPGNYSAYKKAKEAKFAQDLKTYYDQEKQARKIEQAIEKLTSWEEKAHRQSRRKARAEGPSMGSKEYYRVKAKKIAKNVKNTVKRLERLEEERIAKPKKGPGINLSFQERRHGGDRLLTAEGVTKSYGDRVILDQLHFYLRPGEKAALTGNNGTGKTTLLRLILNQEPIDQGQLWISPAAKIGHLDQEIQSIENRRTILEEVTRTGCQPALARQLLAGLLIRGDAVFKPCSVLSMGERVRVALIKLLVAQYDLLLLDEPTNFLDLESREKFEEALLAFEGAVIVVSHDRYLLDRVCGATWHLQNGKLTVYPGKFSQYLAAQGEKKEESQYDKEDKARLELRLAQLDGELSNLDRERNTTEYLALESEYFKIAKKIREMSFK
jgi:macrolide transport system ATP-binding/permease protein